MRDVYARMGKHPPAGTGDDSDGSDGFLWYHAKMVAKRDSIPVLARETIEAQIAGIEHYLGQKGCTTRRLKGKFLALSAAVEAIKALPESTRYLAMSGDDDLGQGFPTTLAHWTVGQNQGGEATFYDHQLKISSEKVQSAFKRKGAKGVGETRRTTIPPGPMGQDLDDDDGCALILTVEK